MGKSYQYRNGLVADVACLTANVDWNNLSEMEKILLTNIPPDMRLLKDEVIDDPTLASLTWEAGTTLLHIVAGEGCSELASLLILYVITNITSLSRLSFLLSFLLFQFKEFFFKS